MTPDKIDQARTAKLAAQAGLDEARRKLDQAEQDVGTSISLQAKRDAAHAALGKAELDLGFCRVRAPFDAQSSTFIPPSASSSRLVPHRCSRWSTHGHGTS